MTPEELGALEPRLREAIVQRALPRHPLESLRVMGSVVVHEGAAPTNLGCALCLGDPLGQDDLQPTVGGRRCLRLVDAAPGFTTGDCALDASLWCCPECTRTMLGLLPEYAP